MTAHYVTFGNMLAHPHALLMTAGATTLASSTGSGRHHVTP